MRDMITTTIVALSIEKARIQTQQEKGEFQEGTEGKKKRKGTACS
jgi:hypothetical protein